MKISTVLINSQKTRKQTVGGLVRNFDEEGNPEDYCALGALACEQGLIKSQDDVEDISYFNIIRAYGVDPEIEVGYPRKSITDKGWGGHTNDLCTVIWRLNDSYKWSFKKIGKFIEKLEKEGVIQYAKN